MWATSSMISESGCSESSRGVHLDRDPQSRRLTITRGLDDTESSGLDVQLSDQEIVTDLLATLPKLKAAVEDQENKAPNWLRKSKSGDSVEIYELLPTRNGKGDDMDLVHSVVASTEIECHLNEVLNVLTSHNTNHDLEASMRAIIPKKKVRQGEVLLQPHATTLDGAPIRRTRATQKSSRGGTGKVVRFDNTTIPEDEEEEDTERKVLVSVSMTRFKSKRRIDLQGRLRNRHQRLQKLCLATLTHQFVGKQRAVHVIKTLPRSVHDQLAPIEEKHQSRSVLGSGLRGLDHISVGFDIQTRTVHCIGARGAAQSTRIIAHGYASVTPPEGFGQQQQRTMTSYSPAELAHDCSKLYEVEAKIGQVTKKRLCVRCITNVDSCIFEDEDFMAALGPAVVDDGYDYEDDYESECEYDNEYGYDRRDENDTYPSVGSTVACSEFESGGSPDDVSSELGPENVLERSMALQTLDRLVNSQIKASGKMTVFERSRLTQSQLSQSRLTQSQLYQSQSQLTQSQLTQSQPSQSQLSQSQLSQSQSQAQFKQSQLSMSQLSQPQPQHKQSELTQSQLNQSQFQQSQLTQSQITQSQLSQSQFKQSQLKQSQFDQSIVEQLRADVEDHLKRTLRATLRDTKRGFAGV
ncbi:hypothetical protein KRP22_004769 [Phytophthora ramorum]|nr:hypothetical protein KRP22_10400 [Phytophthora ramorum]